MSNIGKYIFSTLFRLSACFPRFCPFDIFLFREIFEISPALFIIFYKRKETKMDIVRVSSDVNPNRLASAVRARLEKDTFCQLHAIGAGAVNQSVKAVAILFSFYRDSERAIFCVPSFENITIKGREVTLIRLTVYLDRLLSLARPPKKSYNTNIWKKSLE